MKHILRILAFCLIARVSDAQIVTLYTSITNLPTNGQTNSVSTYLTNNLVFVWTNNTATNGNNVFIGATVNNAATNAISWYITNYSTGTWFSRGLSQTNTLFLSSLNAITNANSGGFATNWFTTNAAPSVPTFYGQISFPDGSLQTTASSGSNAIPGVVTNNYAPGLNLISTLNAVGAGTIGGSLTVTGTVAALGNATVGGTLTGPSVIKSVQFATSDNATSIGVTNGVAAPGYLISKQIGVIGWSSTANALTGGVDIGLSRGFPGMLVVGNGTYTDNSGTLLASNINSQILTTTNLLAAGSVNVTTNLNAGAATITNNLTVNGNASLVGSLSIGGTVTATNALNVGGAESLTGALNVGGTATFTNTISALAGMTVAGAFTGPTVIRASEIATVDSGISLGWYGSGIGLGKSTGVWGWVGTGNTTTGTPDTGLSRGAANTVAVGNGTAADNSGILLASNVLAQVLIVTNNATVNGNVILNTATSGLQFKSGSNARAGTANLVTGYANVANTSLVSGDYVLLQAVADAALTATSLTYFPTNGAGFMITNTGSAVSTNLVYWEIRHLN